MQQWLRIAIATGNIHQTYNGDNNSKLTKYCSQTLELQLIQIPSSVALMSNTTSVQRGRLAIDSELFHFVNEEVLPQVGLQQTQFWQNFELLLSEFIPENQELLATRFQLQQKINAYHQAHPKLDVEHYRQFLADIGYLQADPDDFAISSDNVDAEITTIAGPQLVVPVMNARYALNAVNARWGSLYDALYGTDVIPQSQGLEKGKAYNPLRGEKVVAYGRQLLDQYLPLSNTSWKEITGFEVSETGIRLNTPNESCELASPSQFVGYDGNKSNPSKLLFQHNKLHLIVERDAEDIIGKTDLAFIKDIKLEAAITTIMDCEDSVAAVDAADKTLVYKNWLGLMQGNLSETIVKNGVTSVRKMAPNRQFLSADDTPLTLNGRSLMFVRNVGHLMTNPAIRFDGQEIPEGIMDGVITAAIGKHDIINSVNNGIQNSRQGSIYIVKPKMHGPQEVAFSNRLFNGIEDMLGLKRFTLKMGIMDEERRTSVNLKACVFAAKERVVFINTGFLDRTGDEIHTSMRAGTFARKAELKTRPWISAYEASNVAVGLSTGFQGKAQIGKGMWPVPDQMAAMMEAKQAHVESGATTAWVPSPTAATLHAIHYHNVCVPTQQQALAKTLTSDIAQILEIPLLDNGETLSTEQIQQELENNAQGILGYVVRWVDSGIGCSKVPDINNVGLMEDRATCRISSQHMANWLLQGVCDEMQIRDVMIKMATVVDAQNAQAPDYAPMANDLKRSIAFNAALDLVLKGTEQPSGYTEPLLHKARLAKKRELAERLAKTA